MMNEDMIHLFGKGGVGSMFDSGFIMIMHVALPHCKLALQAVTAPLQHAQPDKGVHTCTTLPLHTAAGSCFALLSLGPST